MRTSRLRLGLAGTAGAVVLAIVVLQLRPAPAPAATPSPSARPSRSSPPLAVETPHLSACHGWVVGAEVPSRANARWFVGLGSGTLPDQIAAEKKFVSDFDAMPGCLNLTLEIVPNASAYDVLKTEIALGKAPDIIGPVGTSGLIGFDGLLADLSPLISQKHTDLSGFDPAVLDYWKTVDGQIGLPYDIYPGYLFYNKDLFEKAGLPPLPARVGEQFQGKDWTWDTLASVAARLTLDKNGKNATEPGFEPKNIVHYGFDTGYADSRQFGSAFGAGTIQAPAETAQIPDAWVHAWNWYYDAMWKTYAAAPENQSQLLLNTPSSFAATGRAAMELSWPWEIQSFASQTSAGGRIQVKNWDIGVLPSYNGSTTSPMFGDTFVITKASKVPDLAYEAILAIMADPTLMRVYGGVPARLSDQAAYFARMNSTLAPSFPGNRVTWSVIDEMASHAAKPSPEAGLPNESLSKAFLAAFWQKLRTDPTLDVTAALAKLKSDLQKSFDATVPLQ